MTHHTPYKASLLDHRLPVLQQLERLILKNWWLLAIIISTFAAYEQGISNCQRDISALEQQRDHLLSEKHEQEALRGVLRREISSQGDPRWIEQTLIKGLGLAPEGSTKVFFARSQTPQTQLSTP